jgi:hypothetical protein
MLKEMIGTRHPFFIYHESNKGTHCGEVNSVLIESAFLDESLEDSWTNVLDLICLFERDTQEERGRVSWMDCIQ